MPMLLPAPGLLSTITCWPNSSDRRLAMMRETVSVTLLRSQSAYDGFGAGKAAYAALLAASYE